MTAPYRPTLISPRNKGGAAHTGISLTFRHNAFTVGEAMASYKIRRRQLAPTLDTYQYWNGTIWTTEEWVTLAAADRAEVTRATGAWTSGATFEWAVATRNSALEGSAWSESWLLFATLLPSLTLSVSPTVTDSRPYINWLFAGGVGRSQACVELAVFVNSETLKPGFDASDENFTAAWRSDKIISGTLSRMRVGEDLASGFTWNTYYRVRDDTGLESGWTSGPSFSTSYVAPTAPSVVVTPDTSSGIVTIDLGSFFNLLDLESSAFESSLGDWNSARSSVLEWDPSGRMRVSFTGQTYGEIDTSYVSYSTMDTAFANYSLQGSSRAVAYSEIMTTSGLGGVSVSASTTHSAVVTVSPVSSQITCTVDIVWYTSAGAFISSSDGAGIACPPGINTNVYIDNVSSPGTAAYAALRVRFESPGNVIGEEAFMDRAALAQSSSVTWTPGGDNVGLGFVVQRKVDGGDWEYVWGATHDAPAGVEGQGQSSVSLKDRALFLDSLSVQYRAYSVSDVGENAKFSAPTLTAPFPFQVRKWFLRSFSGEDNDLAILAGELSKNIDTQVDVIFPAGGKTPVVLNQNIAANTAVRLTATLISTSERIRFETMIQNRETLYLQRNVGDQFFLRPVGSISIRQLASASPGGAREVHRVSFTGQIVS